jgi:hypothetical protein
VKPSRVRFEIRLPIHYNDGTEIEPEKHLQTKEEIFDKFGGFIVITITSGGWRHPNTSEEYEELMGGFIVDVDKETLDKTIEFLQQYKEILKERFKQEEIYIVGYDLYII